MKLNFDRRERMAFLCAAVVLTLVLALLLYVPSTPRKKYAQSQRDITGLRNELRLTKMLKVEEGQRLQSQQEVIALLEKRAGNFDLFTFVHNIVREMGLQDRAQLDKKAPRNWSAKLPLVQLKLDGVSLEELVDFLHTLYASNNVVAVYKMDRLRPTPNGKGLECDLTFVTVKI